MIYLAGPTMNKLVSDKFAWALSGPCLRFAVGAGCRIMIPMTVVCGMIASLAGLQTQHCLATFTLSPTLQDVQGSGSSQGEDDPNVGELTATQLLQRQAIIGQNFGQLERKLFELYQMERDARPRRAQMLRQLYETSQQRATTQRLDSIVKLINDGQLRLAQQSQQQILDDFQSLMLLLQNENQSQKLRDEKKRQQENLRQIKRLLQMQQNLRSSASGGEDLLSLSLPQDQIAKQTQDLAEKMQGQKLDSDSGAEARLQSGSGTDPDSTDVDPSKLGMQAQQGDAPDKDRNSGKLDDSKNRSPSKTDGSDRQPSEDQPSEDQPGQGQAKEGEPKDGPDESGQGQSDNPLPGNDDDSQPQADRSGEPSSSWDQQPEDVEDRIKSAQQKMQQAKQDLDKAKREGALDQMTQAIQQLQEAKEELEKILRQSREEEVTSTLARLEDQFRQMLEAQIRINQKTLQLAQVPIAVRGADQQIATAKLGGQQRKVTVTALRCAMILREDATSVAMALTMDQLQQDMGEVADQLLEGNVEAYTQDSQADIVETLEMLIAAVVQAQEEAQQRQQDDSQDSSEVGEAGETPLVDQIAELKLVRALQQQILKRHEKLSRQYATSDDLFGYVEEADAQQILQKLVNRQGELYQMTREMLKRMN